MGVCTDHGALTLFTPALVVQIWFTQLELYGGPNSAINAVPLDATAFAHRSSLFTIQFYASSPNFQPPYPEEGFSFLDGEPCVSNKVCRATDTALLQVWSRVS